MKFIADLHIHSRFSRATARDLDLESLYVAAQMKGIQVLATGDATHPAWFDEIRSHLVPAEPGLLRLDERLARVCDRTVPERCRGPVRFVLATEISNIYKKDGRTRKNHNLVYLPDVGSALRFNRRLERIGNIHSDGRPILGLDARDLLEIVLETDPRAFLVPAHIWTPWFSLLGSKSGFDSLEECFGDLTGHVFAAETGLSSDPPMNWRVSGLDGLTLVSNSDAHSPAKLGREANRFDTELSYEGIRRALENPEAGGFCGTIEFHPQEGKYHLDGHRKCQLRLDPGQTRRLDGICPLCHRPLTLGVLHRVDSLADRTAVSPPARAAPYVHRVPLVDILAEVLRCGSATKKVRQSYAMALEALGSEFDILNDLSLETIDAAGIPLLAEAVGRMRRGDLFIDGGYDGEFGTVRIFQPGERRLLRGQKTLFAMPAADDCEAVPETPPAQRALFESRPREEAPPATAAGLNPAQRRVVEWGDGPLMVVAGPGTGKTFTLTRRIARLMERCDVPARRILAVTFTHKAAGEMRRRIVRRLGDGADLPEIGTFHGLCHKFRQEIEAGRPLTIVDEGQRAALVRDAMTLVSAEDAPPPFGAEQAGTWIEAAKQRVDDPRAALPDSYGPETRRLFERVYRIYQRLLQIQRLCDFDDLVSGMVIRLENDPELRETFRRRFPYVFVDEYQDLNHAQYRLVRALSGPKDNLCVIGDPDQCIYGFRGSRRRYFERFASDYPGAAIVRLDRSYRSPQTVLDAAGQVIAAGDGRREPFRLSACVPGQRIDLVRTENEHEEAAAIGRIVDEMVGGSGFEAINFGRLDGCTGEVDHGFADFAVLFRTRAQAPVIAQALGEAGIPWQLASRRRLADAPHVAALVSMLRVAGDRASFFDLERVRPWIEGAPGAAAVEAFKAWCYARRFGLAEGRGQVSRLPVEGMSSRRQYRLVDFFRVLADQASVLEDLAPEERVRRLLAGTRLGTAFTEAREDLDLVLSLAASCRDDTELFSRLALCADTDVYDERAQRVALMSLHAAKGLEFPVVFIAGCEDGLIPLRRPGKTVDPAEERRLFYVGLTRARQRLVLCSAARRQVRGAVEARRPSPYLGDIEDRLMHDGTPRRSASAKPRQTQMRLF